VPEEPSPKDQLQVREPTPREVVALKVADLLTSVVFGLSVAVTASLGLTITVMLLVALTPRVSVAVTIAVKFPAVE
jgi:hypothetical protein